MMTGSVRARHALLPVTFRLPGPTDMAVEFVVDTGFTGELTLPAEAVAIMGLPLLHRTTAHLADGSVVGINVHSATVVWRGEESEARVLATGDRPLLGTALLDGTALVVQFREAGLVTVDDL